MGNLRSNVDLAPDPVFRALADPTRRTIVERLAVGEASVSVLAQPLGLTLGAVSKHVGVLAEAGVVVRQKRGRTTYCRLDPAPLRAAAGWMAGLEAEWAGRLDALADVLAPPAPR